MATISGTSAIKNNAQLTCTYSLTVTQGTQSVANNSTTINYSYYVLYDTASVQFVGTTRPNAGTVNVVINGATVASKVVPLTNGIKDGTYIIGVTSGSVSVPHNSDGTKNLSYSISIATGTDQNNYNYVWNASSKSGSMALTTIPRATTPTLSSSSVTMGASVNINLAPASSTFKHKITYSFGGQAGLTSGLSIGSGFSASGNTTVTFTPPTSLGNSIPSANSGACTITVQTYDASGNSIGSAKTLSLTINVPSYTPTISAVSVTGNNLLNGTFVQGKSSVTVKTTSSSSYGASIKSISATVDGKTYSGASFTSNVLNTGSKSVVVTVTDTRGKTKSYTSSAFIVYAYSAPSITAFTAVRSEEDLTVVIATLTGTYASVNGANTTVFAITLNGETKVVESGVPVEFTGVSSEQSFEVLGTITDSYQTTPRTVQLTTEEVLLDFIASGDGLAINKVAENEDELDVNLKARFRKGILSLAFNSLQQIVDLEDGLYSFDIYTHRDSVDLPNELTYEETHYCTGSVKVRNNVRTIILYGRDSRRTVSNFYNGTSWVGWNTLIDSANGGTINGNLTVSGTVKSKYDLTITSETDKTNNRLNVILNGCERGCSYLVSVSYNYNPAGSGYYRSIWTGIVSFPTGYDATNSVHTVPKVTTLAWFEGVTTGTYTPACWFADDKSAIKGITKSWNGQAMLIFTKVVFTNTSVPTLQSATATRIA